MRLMHILEPGTSDMSWITEEQMLLATIPRLTSLISPVSRDKSRGPQRSLRVGHRGMWHF